MGLIAPTINERWEGWVISGNLTELKWDCQVNLVEWDAFFYRGDWGDRNGGTTLTTRRHCSAPVLAEQSGHPDDPVPFPGWVLSTKGTQIPSATLDAWLARF
jgi:hypothetical protein